MPLIDDIAVVPYSAKKGTAQIPPSTTFAADLMTAMAQLLVACGWNLLDTLPASNVIEYPFGFAFAPGTGSGVQGCTGNWLVINTPTVSYRFSSYSPGWTTVPGPCIFFQLGTTPAASLANLALAISTYTPYNAVLTVSPTLLITITAKVAGPDRNFDTIAADGRYGVTSGLTAGGGYVVQSVGTSPYAVTVTGQLVGVNTEGVQFDFAIGPTTPTDLVGTVTYKLATNGANPYTVVANPYSFAAFDGSSIQNSLAVFAPCIPTAEGFTAAYCVFVVGPGNLTDRLMWGGGALGQADSISLDAAPITLADTLRGPGVLSLRVGGLPAFTLNGQPLLTAAYAMMAPSYSGTPGIVGKLWDCAVLTNTLEIGGTFENGGRTYICIAAQDGTNTNTNSSLLFCMNDNGQPNAGANGSGGGTGTGGSGSGGGSSPVNPTAPPASGNGSLTGKCSDPTGGTTITWNSGDRFSPSMVGQTLTISLPTGSVIPYVTDSVTNDKPIVASFVNATAITVPNPLNSAFDGALYTSP